MKRLATLTAAVTLLSGAAASNAADLTSTKDGLFSASSSNTWTGFYVGINGGYGWDNTLNFKDAIAATGDNPAQALATGVRPAGWFGGLTAEADVQVSGIVLGAVTDIDLANIADDSALKTCTGLACSPVPSTGSTTHSTIDWFGTFRGKAGLPIMSSILVYGTGGLAYGGVSNRAVSANTALANSTDLFGWTGGAGIEYQVSPGWRLAVEYLYVDLGSQTLGGVFNGASTATNHQNNVFDLVRFGLVYKIGSDLKHPE